MEVLPATVEIQHPLPQPRREAAPLAADLVVAVVDLVIAVVVALDRRRMRAARLVHHGGNAQGWREDAVRVALNQLRGHDLLGHQDHGASGQRGRLTAPEAAPAVRVTILRGPLDLQYGDVRDESRYQDQRLTIE